MGKSWKENPNKFKKDRNFQKKWNKKNKKNKTNVPLDDEVLSDNSANNWDTTNED